MVLGELCSAAVGVVWAECHAEGTCACADTSLRFTSSRHFLSFRAKMHSTMNMTGMNGVNNPMIIPIAHSAGSRLNRRGYCSPLYTAHIARSSSGIAHNISRNCPKLTSSTPHFIQLSHQLRILAAAVGRNVSAKTSCESSQAPL